MGIIFNMYANEAPGQKFPSMKLLNCSGNQADDCTFDGPQVYPEYLTDVNICVCPSDSDAESVRKAFHQDGDLSKPVLVCALARGSYYYTGFALYPPAVLKPGVTVPSDPNYFNGKDPVAELPNYVSEDVIKGAMDAIDFSSGAIKKKDEDWDPAPIRRLRMGIERFFITDINNPASSAIACSNLAVMWDEIAVYGKPATFNHVPGGGNVLYMDGHCEFLKWPSVFPADTLGLLLSDLF